MTGVTTTETYGVVRPTRDGQWWAAHGVGSATVELGIWPTEEEATTRASAGNRHLIRVQRGETGWDALAREGRVKTAGGPVPWMTAGHVTIVECGSADRLTLAIAASGITDLAYLPIRVDGAYVYVEGRRLRMTRVGEIVWDAIGRPIVADDLGQPVLPLRVVDTGQRRAEHWLVACGLCHRSDAELDRPANPHLVCPWCRGVAYAGDLEPTPQLRPVEAGHESIQIAPGSFRCSCLA